MNDGHDRGAKGTDNGSKTVAAGADGIEVVGSLDGIEESSWNALVDENDPFMEYGFLRALEVSGATGDGTGWLPRYFLLRSGGSLTGAIAAYLKLDSYGEFVFDWQWADAYHRAGIDYYPKLVSAAPFTPASGTRLLLGPGEDNGRSELLAAAARSYAARSGCSGMHFLFVTAAELECLTGCDYLPRVTYQFHWQNQGYQDFDGFLADLRASKRKQIRKERRKVADYGLEIETLTGADIKDEHIEAMWHFYRNTTARKWGEAYLKRRTFDELVNRCRDRLLMVMARDADRWVAGTFNLFKGEKIFGRYWGAAADYPGLHFECCYYRLIDYAIAGGMRIVEAGAQGEHKFLRGFVAKPTYSAHWLAHPSGRAAIERYLDGEREQMQNTIEGYNGVSPVKDVRSQGRTD